MPSIFTQAVHAGARGPAPQETPVTTLIYHSADFLEPSAARMDCQIEISMPGERR
jgi:hypothetical protein